MKNRASQCGRIVPVTVEQSCQWLLKNFATVTVEKSCQSLLKSYASDCWRIVLSTVEESCQWLLNNRASDCWSIIPVTVEESCQPLLNNRASNCWRIVLVTAKQSCQRLLHIILKCWAIVPVAIEELYQQLLKNCASTVEDLCQWLLMNRARGCWTACQLFFSLFLTYFGKTLPIFSCKYFNYYCFNSGSQLSKLQDYWLIIIFIFSLYTFYQTF